MTVELIAPDEHLTIPAEVCEAFLELLATNPGIGHVSTLRELGVPGTRRQIKDAIERQLKADIDAVRNDVIRTALYQRGIDGLVVDVWHNGTVVGQRREYSDRCLVALAQMKLPEARNQLDVSVGGAGGGPVRVEVEGGRVTTLGDVIDLAVQLGVPSVVNRLAAAAAASDVVPSARALLPNPSDG